jgi:uncharacterized protein YbdZ (MbtH family)
VQEIANVFDYTVVECNYVSELYQFGEKLIWPKDMEIPEGWVEVPTSIAHQFIQTFNAAC